MNEIIDEDLLKKTIEFRSEKNLDEISKIAKNHDMFVRKIPPCNTDDKCPIDENTVRVIKIGKKALFEFIYEHMIDETECHMNVDDTSVLTSFDIDWERGEFIFCASKLDDKFGKFLKLPDEIDLKKVMKNIPDTTVSMYDDCCKYKEYTKDKLIELSK